MEKDASHFDLYAIKPMQTQTIYCVLPPCYKHNTIFHSRKIRSMEFSHTLSFHHFSLFRSLFVYDEGITSNVTTRNRSFVTSQMASAFATLNVCYKANFYRNFTAGEIIQREILLLC